MIKNFKGKETEKIFYQEFSKKIPPSIQKQALRKLMIIDVAESLSDLHAPPANHLEPLSGDSKGKWRIRINKQWRIVFIPCDGGKNYRDVEIIDYH